MNNQVLEFCRKQIKEGLSKLPEEWQIKFKRMYAHGHLDKDINKVVDDMPEGKLDWALSQVDNSLKKTSK